MPAVREVRPISKPHHCNDCNLAFAKLEHLARHLRTHTLEKPFECAYCARYFNRLDSLQRHHRRVHKTEPLSYRDYRHRNALEPHFTSFQGDDPPHFADEPPPFANAPPHFANSISTEYNSDPEHMLIDQAPVLVDQDPLIAILEAASAQQNLMLPDPMQVQSNTDALDLDPNSPFWSDTFWNLISGRVNNKSYDFLYPNLTSVPSMPAPITEPFDTVTPSNAHRAYDSIKSILNNATHDLNPDDNLFHSTWTQICLENFWSKLSHPHLSILHKPTFNSKHVTPALLLVLVGLGSLFESKAYVRKQGEILVRLVQKTHAAAWERTVENGWHEQMAQVGCIGQRFTMLSGIPHHISTCLSFAPVAISWARLSGIQLEETSPVQSEDLNLNEALLTTRWQDWAKMEARKRTLLNLYINDSQISSFIGGVTTLRQFQNSLTLPCAEEIFQATTPLIWKSLIEASEVPLEWSMNFREFYALFLGDNEALAVRTLRPLSPLVYLVVLEALSSEITALHELKSEPLKRLEIDWITLENALQRWFKAFSQSKFFQTDDSDLLVRWHTVSIQLLVSTAKLESLLIPDGVKRSTFWPNTILEFSDLKLMNTPNPVLKSKSGRWLTEWINSRSARQCLVHATEILKLREDDISRVRQDAPHAVGCVFIATMVIHSYALGIENEMKVTSLPLTPIDTTELDWICLTRCKDVDLDTFFPLTTEGTRSSLSFLRDGGLPIIEGSTLQGDYHLIRSLAILRKLGTVWGIAERRAEQILCWPRLIPLPRYMTGFDELTLLSLSRVDH